MIVGRWYGRVGKVVDRGTTRLEAVERAHVLVGKSFAREPLRRLFRRQLHQRHQHRRRVLCQLLRVVLDLPTDITTTL